MLNVLNRLDEITLAGIARKQRSITRLFPEFPARVKGVANKGGIRLLQMQPDYWHFKLHSGTEDNLWYDGYIRFKDLVEFLSNKVGDRRLWTRSKEHVDLKKLAKKVMFDCQIQVSCSCPAFQYWGPSYILSLSKYDGKVGDRETRPPRKRNPRQYGAICKHVQAMLNAYPFYMTTLAGFLRDTHTGQIRYLENQAKKESGEFKKAAAELRRRKQAKEEEPKEPVEAPEAEETPAEVEEEPRESRVREAFEDQFKSISKDEHMKRNPKPKAKKGDIVKWGRVYLHLEPKILIVDPRWSSKRGHWYSTTKVYGAVTWIWYKPEEGRWYTTSMLPTDIVDEAFADVFQPIDKDTHWRRLGIIKNDDGTWTFGKYTFDPKAKPKYPILSHRYNKNVYVVGQLDKMPIRATSFQKVVNTLADNGVKWLEFNRLQMIPPKTIYRVTGIQVVGTYDDMMIIFETKVGVANSSAGYLAWVGFAKDVQSAATLTYQTASGYPSRTSLSALALLKWTLKRMKKFADKKSRTGNESKDGLLSSEDHMWNREKAESYVDEIKPMIEKAGYKVAIVGAVQARGWSDCNLDIMLIPVKESCSFNKIDEALGGDFMMDRKTYAVELDDKCVVNFLFFEEQDGCDARHSAVG